MHTETFAVGVLGFRCKTLKVVFHLKPGALELKPGDLELNPTPKCTLLDSKFEAAPTLTLTPQSIESATELEQECHPRPQLLWRDPLTPKPSLTPELETSSLTSQP